MFSKEFIDSFSRLGERLLNWQGGATHEPVLEEAIVLAHSNNPFFTPFMQRHALETIARTFLERKELERWRGNYVVTGTPPEPEPAEAGAYVGVIMAGNLPLVGFHDFLCILAGGAGAVVKLSSKDKNLLPALFRMLVEINPLWRGRVVFTENIGEYMRQYPDTLAALISTGSDVTREAVARQFVGIPMLLRGRRFSFAVLSGKENEEELEILAEDVFLYFGMGCRSVNYLWVPRGYDFTKLCAAFSKMRTLLGSDCYMNNYKRMRAMLILEGKTVVDGGFFLLLQTPDVYPPVAVTGYAEYDSETDILLFENQNREYIQKKYRTFGLAQTPAVDEYADEMDTMAFLLQHIPINIRRNDL